MAGFNITQSQFRNSLQNIQNRFIKLELLNYQFQVVDNLEGVVTSGTLTVNAEADIRRSANIVLVVRDSSFEVEPGGKVWLDKYIRVYVGIANLVTNNIEYTNCGIYIIDAPSYSYNPTTNTLGLSLLDMMAKLTGVRNGYLPGIPYQIKANENIRKAIIDTLALGGFTKYVVEEAPSPGVVPNDMEFGQGTTVFEILSALRDIYPNHEIYFDINGTFFYRTIPSGDNDGISVDDSLWEKITTAEQIEINFQNVKNIIEVYGRIHEPAHFSENTTISGNTIVLAIADVTAYTPDLIYGFYLTNPISRSNFSLRINGLTSYPVRTDDGDGAQIQPESGQVYYCVQYKNGYWRWLGHLQAYGYAEDNNPSSPFYINGSVGKIRLPLFDGDYANCITDDLAQERAEYELYLHAQLNDNIRLTCVPVYWLDVNILVEYTQQRNQQKNKYLIKSLNMGLGVNDSMTVTMMRYYSPIQRNL